jgi:formate dehydrogenase gamma subunit
MMPFARIRFFTLAVTLLLLVSLVPTIAQKLGPDGAPNPTASVVDQQTLLKQAPRIEGRIDIPDTKAAVLIQPAGRTWDAFASVSQAGKYAHNFAGFAFLAGLVLITVIFFKDNLPEKVDLEWLKQGGGFIKGKHAPAGRFNLGEKLVYWLSVAGGVAVSASGILLLFPFFATDIFGMQLAQVVHAVIAILFVALILAHIYIGTLGMEGAFEAMGSGEVDLNWAKEHHDLWLAQQLAKENRQPAHSATPAE